KEILQARLVDLVKAKPVTSKGQYLQKISVSSTMGPGVIVDQSTLNLKQSCYRSARRRVGRLRAVAAGMAVGDSLQRPQVRSARNDDGQGARAGRESPSWLAGPLNRTLRGPPAQIVPPSGSCSGAVPNRQPDRP